MEETKLFRKFTENFLTIFQKIIFHKINPKSFFQGLLLIFKFSGNCSLGLAAKSIEQDGAILPDDQPIKL